MPALIYFGINQGNDANLNAWTIPTATNIAFALGILPLFVFANAGVSFDGIGLASFTEPVKLGISSGLFIGSLAFEHSSFDVPIRLGVLTGSILSAVGGYLLLRYGPRPVKA